MGRHLRFPLTPAASPKKAKVDAPVASIFSKPSPSKASSSKPASKPSSPVKKTSQDKPAEKPASKDKPVSKDKPASKDKGKAPATNGKPLASIFTKPAPKAKKEDDDDEHVPKDEEGEDEISDEELEAEDDKAAVKLASIFTKNNKSVPVADKGWKEGEP